MRETKADFVRRVQADNDKASNIPLGTATATIFGVTTLGKNLGPGEGGWDVYEVRHSGHVHQWSSASVVATFV